jgi:Fur family transcriptional regulator, ferric uptake regulator
MKKPSPMPQGGRKLGQRNTRQRGVVLEVIRDAHGPLTVPSILSKCRSRLPGIGVATIYRAVVLLADAGLVQRVLLPGGETAWERAGMDHHHHFHCTKCGRVFCLDFCPFSPGRRTRLPRGFVVKSHSITAHGLCPDCRNT